jgi:hypothetical protein
MSPVDERAGPAGCVALFDVLKLQASPDSGPSLIIFPFRWWAMKTDPEESAAKRLAVRCPSPVLKVPSEEEASGPIRIPSMEPTPIDMEFQIMTRSARLIRAVPGRGRST